MTETRIGNSDQPLEAIILERKKMEQAKKPDLELVDRTILKQGPKAYKVVLHWAIRDRHTDELHHHSIKIETYFRYRAGWKWNEERSITLDHDDIHLLLTFLATLANANIPEDSGKYLIIPLSEHNDHLVANEGVLDTLIDFCQKSGDEASVFARLLDRATQSDNMGQFIEKLADLDVDNLQKLNAFVGINNLRRILDIWRANKENDNEEYWQTLLSEHSFVFAQVFSLPLIVVREKAYVGGKGIENTGGNILDFLLVNQLTSNVTLVEIKTPKTRILGPQYRGDIYNISADVSGAIIQVSNYKDTLSKEYDRLVNQSQNEFDAFDPKAMVLLGNTEAELTDQRQRKSFELFRNGLKNVEIITYDELFKKVEFLLNFLEGESLK